jgi:hypothetical protein
LISENLAERDVRRCVVTLDTEEQQLYDELDITSTGCWTPTANAAAPVSF